MHVMHCCLRSNKEKGDQEDRSSDGQALAGTHQQTMSLVRGMASNHPHRCRKCKRMNFIQRKRRSQGRGQA